MGNKCEANDLQSILQNEVNETEKEKLLFAFSRNPDDPLTAYCCAAIHDKLGYEQEAVPFYLKSLENGISGNERIGAFLGLGSTYRTLGKYEKSAEILIRGVKEFPEANELKVFYTMTLYNLGSHKEAVQELLKLLDETTKDEAILSYRRAIRFYADDLDKTWE
ncbi:tetratricopeptide repeat protein [Bacillus gobiensis]|uniref:tetratricopeptide repeat protein n=1 Tax=Bacillus gobiensis TaxID=1441095 RepID=UPI003D1F7DD6